MERVGSGCIMGDLTLHLVINPPSHGFIAALCAHVARQLMSCPPSSSRQVVRTPPRPAGLSRGNSGDMTETLIKRILPLMFHQHRTGL